MSMSKPYVPPPGYLPVFKPALPYHHLLPDGLQPETFIYVQGIVSQHAKRFWVNFACGQHEGANIPFHFNPSFDGNDKIALNTFQDSNWDTEEHHEMPFQNGKHFEIIFIVNDEEYQILVNKDPFFNYKHRMPPQCVKVVSIDGDLEMQSLAVIERPKIRNMCRMQKPGDGTPQNPIVVIPPFIRPMVPFKSEIFGGLKPNVTVITIRGYIPEDACSFAISFVAGPDIALTINVCLDESTVIRNSFLKGSWGQEERELPYNPFQYGQYFELSISCDQYRFIVYANDEYFFSYAHRYIHFPQIKILEIKGDVSLCYVT